MTTITKADVHSVWDQYDEKAANADEGLRALLIITHEALQQPGATAKKYATDGPRNEDTVARNALAGRVLALPGEVELPDETTGEAGFVRTLAHAVAKKKGVGLTAAKAALKRVTDRQEAVNILQGLLGKKKDLTPGEKLAVAIGMWARGVEQTALALSAIDDHDDHDVITDEMIADMIAAATDGMAIVAPFATAKDRANA